MPYASIIHDTRIGNNTKVYQNAVVGADPQDFRWQGERGLCVIGNNCVIRENVIINRSIREGQATTIGDEVYVLAESHIGHDSLIKGKTVLGNGVTIAGDAEVGECTIMSSNTMLHERCKIGDWVLIKGGCRIGNNVPPYSVFAHNPAEYDGVNAVVMTRHASPWRRSTTSPSIPPRLPKRHIHIQCRATYQKRHRAESRTREHPQLHRPRQPASRRPQSRHR